MKNTLSLLLISFIIFFTGCSKPAGKTDAKVKINLSSFTSALEGSVGAGGGILFGKSNNGEQFGKLLSGSDESVELTNGDWMFYAIMWENEVGSGYNLIGTAFCGKSSQKLTGKTLNISMSLNNNNCSDSEFGQSYTDAANLKIKFARFYMEECDSLSKAGSTGCGGFNQGSAGSYQLIFQNYVKDANGGVALIGESIRGACTPLIDMVNGLNSNFPTGSASMKFSVSVEMFFGNENCAADAKGSYVYNFKRGLSEATSGNNILIPFLGNTCVLNTTGASEETCTTNFGVYNRSAGYCSTSSYPPIAQDFLPTSMCQMATGTTTRVSVKQLVAIPKNAICDRYEGKSVAIGGNPFAAGLGTDLRPYRICNEWQMNQIGEVDALGIFGSTTSYKLANDLDMNRASELGPYSKPICAGTGNIDKYANFNPIGTTRSLDCNSATSPPLYDGIFDGNGYTIKNIRAEFKDQDYIGLFRELGYGTIKNLSLQNVEMAGNDNVGGVVGKIYSSYARVTNVKINDSRVKGMHKVGGAIGITYFGGNILNQIQITNGNIDGDDYVGGLVGDNFSTITQSSFRGEIKAHNKTSVGAATYSGGLVGVNETNGKIYESFSEGTINSQTAYTGGLVGNNQGQILSGYSTMVMGASDENTVDGIVNVIVGGIAGTSVANSISSVYFDGSYRSLPGTNPANFKSADIVYGVVGCVGGSTCLGPSTISYNDLRNGSVAGFNAEWRTGLIGPIPRFLWEEQTRECLDPDNLLSFTAQPAINGHARGSFAFPFTICTAAQLSSIISSGVNVNSKFFKILDDINLLYYKASSRSAMVDELHGNILGNNRIIYNLIDLSNSTPPKPDNGLFGIIKPGTIVSDLILAGNSLTSRPNENSMRFGILAGTNSGFVKNIKMFNNELSAYESSGLFVGVNQGTITGVSSSKGLINGNGINLGGLVGINSGNEIKIVEADTIITDSANAENFGGIVGKNNSILNQAKFSGAFKVHYAISTGGIAGLNTSAGSISNVYTSNEVMISAEDGYGIGGLVGDMDGGSIETSFNLAKIQFTNETPALDLNSMDDDTRIVGPIIGVKLAASLIKPSVNYLAQTLAHFNQSVIIASCPSEVAILSSSITPDLAALRRNGSFDFFAPGDGNGYNYTFNAASDCVAGHSIDFYDLLNNYDEYGIIKTVESFSDLTNFCSTFSGNSGSEKCNDSNGFDIASMTQGQDRIIKYHLAKMNGTALPLDVPVWELSDGDSHPKLLRLDN